MNPMRHLLQAVAALGLMLAMVACTSTNSDDTPVLRLPELSVRASGPVISDGDTTPSQSDGTDLGASLTSLQRSFTISNDGAADLVLPATAVTLSGSNASVFSITQPTGLALQPGQSTTFGITFDASGLSAGASVTATVSIASNDRSNSSYSFAIAALQGDPNITLISNNLRIADATVVDLGSQSSAANRVFTLSNSGDAAFNLTALSLLTDDTSGNGSYAITNFSALSDTALAPGESTSFTVTYTPSYTISDTDFTTPLTAEVRIGHDIDGGSSYNFRLTALPVVPTLEVRGNSIAISPGDTTPSSDDHTNFGQVFAAQDRTFTLVNTGAVPVFFIGDNPLSLTSNDDGNGSFTINQQPLVSELAGGANTTMGLRYTPTYNAEQTLFDDPALTAVMSLQTSIGAIEITIAGSAVRPSFEVRTTNSGAGASTVVPPQSTPTAALGTALGSVSQPISRSFDIVNTADAPLHFTQDPQISVTMDNNERPGAFEISAQPGTIEVASSDSTSFTVTYNPSGQTELFGVVETATIVIATTAGDAQRILISGSSQDPNAVPNLPFTVAGQRVGASTAGAIAANSTTTAAGTGTLLETAPGSSTTSIFTITNTGTNTLTFAETNGSRVAVSDTLSVLTVLSQPAATIAPGGTATFTLQYAPDSSTIEDLVNEVSFSFVDNNSPTGRDNPFRFAVRGDPLIPRLQITGANQVIESGDSTPSTEDGTAFGTVIGGNDFIDRDFIVTNTGEFALTITSATLVDSDGNAIAGFTVLSDGNDSDSNPDFANPIAPSQTQLFTIRFDPRLAQNGSYTGIVTLASNAPETPSYTFTVSCQQLGPQIIVSGPIFRGTPGEYNDIVIDGSAAPAFSTGTDYDQIPLGAERTRIFRITNTGTAELDLVDTPRVLVQNPNNGGGEDFYISTPPDTPIAPGETTTFALTYNAESSSLATATVRIRTNVYDPGNDFVTATFDVSGSGYVTPRIGVQYQGTSREDVPFEQATATINNGTQFGAGPVAGSSISREFIITNPHPTDDLELTGNPRVVITGEHASDFTVTVQPLDGTNPNNRIIAAGAERTFTIAFTPGGPGPRNAVVSIENSDQPLSPYTFAVSGTGIAPVISISNNGTVIANGDENTSPADGTNFGRLYVVDHYREATFTITNNGNADLQLTGNWRVDLTGADAANFQVHDGTEWHIFPVPARTRPPEEPAVDRIAPGDSADFRIFFNPYVIGPLKATAVIRSNDPLIPAYSFAVEGFGLSTPMRVTGMGRTIPGDQSKPSELAPTDDWPHPAYGTFFDHVDHGIVGRNRIAVSLDPANILSIDWPAPIDSGKFSQTYLVQNLSETDELLIYDWEVTKGSDGLVAVQDFTNPVEVTGNYRLPIRVAACFPTPPDEVVATFPTLALYQFELERFGETLSNIVIIDPSSLNEDFATHIGTSGDAELTRQRFLENVRVGDVLVFGGQFAPQLEQPTNEGHRFRVTQVGWPWVAVEKVLDQDLLTTQLSAMSMLLNNDFDTTLDGGGERIANATQWLTSQTTEVIGNFNDIGNDNATTQPIGFSALFYNSPNGNNGGRIINIARPIPGRTIPLALGSTLVELDQINFTISAIDLGGNSILCPSGGELASALGDIQSGWQLVLDQGSDAPSGIWGTAGWRSFDIAGVEEQTDGSIQIQLVDVEDFSGDNLTDDSATSGYIVRAENGSMHRRENASLILTDFTVTDQPESPVAANGLTSFTVRYEPRPLSPTLLLRTNPKVRIPSTDNDQLDQLSATFQTLDFNAGDIIVTGSKTPIPTTENTDIITDNDYPRTYSFDLLGDPDNPDLVLEVFDGSTWTAFADLPTNPSPAEVTASTINVGNAIVDTSLVSSLRVRSIGTDGVVLTDDIIEQSAQAYAFINGANRLEFTLQLDQTALNDLQANHRRYPLTTYPASRFPDLANVADILLQPGEVLPFTVTFSPDTDGLRKAGINIQSNDGSKPIYDVPVVGTGTVAAMAPTSDG